MPVRNHIRIKNRMERLAWAEALPVGEFFGSLRLRWLDSKLFLHMPEQENPFGFVRANGERITPDFFPTDGGSINLPQQVASQVTPWMYGPAFVLHDWPWHRRRIGQPIMSFEDSNIILAEAMRTLMADGSVDKRLQDIVTVYDAVSSPWARRKWNKYGKDTSCPSY